MKSGRRKGRGDEGTSSIELLVKTLNPEDFLSANEKVSTVSLDALKKTYDLTKVSENQDLDNPLGLQTDVIKTKIPLRKQKKKRQATISKAEAPLPCLITEGFDEDQIWEEIEIQNGVLYENLVTSVSKLLAYREKTMEVVSDDSSFEDGDISESELQLQNFNPPKNTQEGESEESDFFQSDESYRKKRTSKVEGRQYPKSEVDDKFFSLAQMTEHIERVEAAMEQAEDKRLAAKNENSEDDESSGEESIDFFEDVPSDTEEIKDERTEYFYKDFFDPPLDASENQVEKRQERMGFEETEDIDEDEEHQSSSFDNRKSVRFNLGAEEDEDSESEDEDSKTDKNIPKLSVKVNETLSTLEKRNKKILESIQEIEKEALEPKSWQLLGEATAESRPENALLEEHLVYEHLIRPAPEITVETTGKLEDVIKQRIKDGAWDDVQRKVKPIEDPREFKKRLVLDAEKSKASLAEIYEQEYLDVKKSEEGETDEKEPEEHVLIKKEMQSLFAKLDAISHYHYTPKPPSAEVKIVTNVPAISIEDVAPVSVSDASMLAPQEITDHIKGPIKGKEERTDTDRKRERRKKKKKQHIKRLIQEDKARTKGLGLRNIKLADGIVKSQKSKTSNDSSNHQNTKELKSSKAFFAKLQESAAAHISNVAKRKKALNETNKASAKKFKL
ncbi:U3 small nucleolar ribonucleoprotein MPP10 [Orchesella cincta]|uniref:U3 small nucleolar ribonucleoprotein protein MPP10 n=1 Tax=Orchesella cincta TaxID=48709 RepID=A0A1D2MUA0_ORCCI|nr:U3 small nucleolar ribonucleoprotein MPP10 [Orchesella cincta]